MRISSDIARFGRPAEKITNFISGHKVLKEVEGYSAVKTPRYRLAGKM